LVSPAGEAEDAGEVRGELLDGSRVVVDGVGNANLRQDLAGQ
jgi:hypothetical protein